MAKVPEMVVPVKLEGTAMRAMALRYAVKTGGYPQGNMVSDVTEMVLDRAERFLEWMEDKPKTNIDNYEYNACGRCGQRIRRTRTQSPNRILHSAWSHDESGGLLLDADHKPVPMNESSS